jgi:ElaB/YqjD/DUF883 family membrane-anchored ribosome-binding protein
MRATIGFLSRLALAVAILALLAATMAGCEFSLRNEARIKEAEAQTAQAQADSDKWQAQERIAYHDSQTAIVSEQEKTERANAFTLMLPWLILAVGAVAGALLALWYRGRAHLVTVQAQAQVAMMLPPPWQWPALPPPTQRPALPARDEAPAAVARAAERVGGLYRPDPDTPGAWLIEAMDGSRRIRMLPAPRE